MYHRYLPRRLRFLILLSSLFLGAFGVQAQTIWTGAAGTDWFEPSNWSAGLPAAGNDAIIPGGGSAVIGEALDADYAISNFGEITLTAPVVAAGGFTNSGTLTVRAELTALATFENFGDLDITPAGAVQISATATGRSNGGILSEGRIDLAGTFVNEGAIDVTADGQLAITGAGELTNAGVIEIGGRAELRDASRYLAPSGGQLAVLAGGTLELAGSAELTNAGVVRVEDEGLFEQRASFVNDPGRTFVAGTLRTFDGSTTRSNFLTVEPSGRLLIERGDDFDVVFSLVNEGQVTVERAVTIRGELRNAEGATLTTVSPGVLDFVEGTNFINAGTVVNGGVVRTVGTLANAGLFTNAGTIDQRNGGTIDNDGSFINEALIDNVDRIVNDGEFANRGRLTNGSGGIIENNATFTNAVDAVVENRFEVYNNATLVNRGFVQNGVTIYNAAELDNYGFLANVGDVRNQEGATFTNYASGVVDNSGAGIFTNDGLFANFGEFNNFSCGILVVNGTFENNQWIQNDGIVFVNGTLSGKAVMGDGPVVAQDGTSPKICQPYTQKLDEFGATVVGAVRFAAERFDSCDALQYLIDGEEELSFGCDDIGTHELTFTLVDRRGNRINCATTLTIVDESAPRLANECPGDIAVDDVESAPAPVSWTPPMFVDNCDEDVAVTSNFSPGDLFPEGPTVVTYTATDDFGNEIVCEFTVTVTVRTAVCAPKEARGLVAYYNLREGEGRHVLDRSGYGEPLPLRIENAHEIDWLEGCGLVNDGESIVKSTAGAKKIGRAAMMSNALTVEAWVRADKIQTGPERIVTYSENTRKRNFTLGQEGDRYVFRLKTTRTNDNGTPNRKSRAGAVRVGELQHVVFTRDAGGEERMYVDGELQYSGRVGGDFSTWGVHCRLALFNEMTLDRSFKGAIRNVAIYDRALSQVEVRASLARGACCEEGDDSPLGQLCEGPRGQVTYERYEGIGGIDLPWLYKAAKFPARPDFTAKLTQLDLPRNVGDEYGSRTRGFIYPEISGDYRFAVSGDDHTRLLLSTVAGDPAHAAVVAAVKGWTQPGELHKYPDQKSGQVHLQAGEAYYFELLHKEARGGDHASVYWKVPGAQRFAIVGAESIGDVQACGRGSGELCEAGRGGLLRQVWRGIESNDIWALMQDPRYPDSPEDESLITEYAGPNDTGDNYGTRVRGYVHPDVSGEYRFTLTGDNQTKLMLSTDESADNARAIAEVNGWTRPTEFDKFDSQRSGKVYLEAGRRYYTELVHQEGVGGDHFNVYWQTPRDDHRRIVPGANLSPFVDCDETDGPASCNRGVLFVVGNTRLNDGDAAVKHRLIELGYDVMVKDAQWASAELAADKGLVVISSTVRSEHIGRKFRDVAVPVLVYEAWLYDDLGMTGAKEGRDYGTQHIRRLIVTDAGDELAAGREGSQRVLESEANVPWGKVMGSEARVIAHAPADPWLASVFVYDAGAQMAGGMRAPAARVGFYLHNETAAQWTHYGRQLFDAAVAYATGCEPAVRARLDPEVLTLRAAQLVNEVQLEWTTNTAFKNVAFLIERSGDGDVYEVIDEVPARGEGADLEAHAYVDAAPLPGENFYRVTAVHSDGGDRTSELRLVSFAALGQVGMFPNPADDRVTISLDGFDDHELELVITDAFGRTVVERPIASGAVVVDLDLTPLAAGTYGVTLKTDGYRVTKVLAMSRD